MPSPRIVVKPIPFGPARLAETRAYAGRHYHLDTWRLRRPRVIVEHYTASDSFASAYSTFASNAANLGELPGVCAHYVIDTDGTIYRLVPTSIICRHTVGLNWTAIGIEHVGTSDAQILREPAATGCIARADVMAHEPVRDPAPERHRAQREPDQPVPP